MYLNISKHKSIPDGEVIGIFDMDNATVSQITRAYLTGSQKKQTLIDSGDDLPKSFIVCRDKSGNKKVYFSKFSAASLLGRLKQ